MIRFRAGIRSLALTLASVTLAVPFALAQAPLPNAKDIVAAMAQKEAEASAHRDHYMYLSNERSERTGGHLWTERVVETPSGRVRRLLVEDGKPLTPEREAEERNRLNNDAAHPDAFISREKAEKDDEAHARQMLALLGRGFILENIRDYNGDWHIDFRPDPNYSPSGMEERVLHGMSGWMLIDQKSQRLHHIEGRLAADLSIGFGLLATVKAGSHFETTKAPFNNQWRTVRVVTDIRGKAAIFKTIAKNTDVTRGEFVRVDNNLTIPQAVEKVLSAPGKK